VEALEDINERLRFVRMAVQSDAHRVQTTAGEHLMILEAIERKDAEAARRTVRRNISHSRNNVEIAISRALTSAHQQHDRQFRKGLRP
jgi:DNA-binding GntR family transcriptional regulator